MVPFLGGLCFIPNADAIAIENNDSDYNLIIKTHSHSAWLTNGPLDRVQQTLAAFQSIDERNSDDTGYFNIRGEEWVPIADKPIQIMIPIVTPTAWIDRCSGLNIVRSADYTSDNPKHDLLALTPGEAFVLASDVPSSILSLFTLITHTHFVYTGEKGYFSVEEAAWIPSAPPPDQPGSISFNNDTPAVGTQIKATLTDPDGSLTSIIWVWEREYLKNGKHGGWKPFAASVNIPTSTYTPVQTDVGNRFRVIVSYADGHGIGKQVFSEATQAVR